MRPFSLSDYFKKPNRAGLKQWGFIILMLIFGTLFYSTALADSTQQQSVSVPKGSSNPKPNPSPVALPNNWQELGQTTSSPNAVLTPVLAFPNSNWWEQFQDATLNQYVNLALQNNNDLQLAALRVKEAQELAKVARAAQRPQLSVSPQYFRTRLSDAAPVGVPGLNYNQFSVPLVASYEADIFGRNRDITRSYLKEALATEQNRRAVKAQLIANVTGVYINLLRSDKVIVLEQQLIDIEQKSLALRQLQYNNGLISYDAILLLLENLADAQDTLNVYQKQQAISAHQLAVLIGESPKTSVDTPRKTFDDLPLLNVLDTGIPSQLIVHRPDIQASELELERTQINVQVARKQFLPTISLTGEIGLLANTFAHLTNLSSYIYVIGGSIFQSLYTGGAKTANLQVQKTRMEEELRVYGQTILVSLQEVEDSLSSFKFDRGQYFQNVERIQFAEKGLKLTQERFQQGIISKTDVLALQQQYVTYQQLATQYKGDSLIDVVSLYNALGGGF